ncbi:MAG: DUF2158 domain-containing protein [Rhizobiales bacterium]|nr:DUF2158 domain-containing protein [Hyphomicrobiales bacterium]
MFFKIGDVVTLKSGSPRMTVVKIDNATVACTFFRRGQITNCEFPAATLEPLELPEPQARSFWSRWFRNASPIAVRG